MSPLDLFRAVWQQAQSWPGAPAGASDCPEGVPVHEEGRCDDCDSSPLTALSPGEEATVSCLDAGDRAVARLAALGILPGVRLRLVQRYPTFVFRVGYAEVAIDHALASMVHVRRG